MTDKLVEERGEYESLIEELREENMGLENNLSEKFDLSSKL